MTRSSVRTTLGALVILGDSLGDRGGVGPFYYELLAAALSARSPQLQIVNRAMSGSRSPSLAGQIARLPASLPGNVVVSMTSGGNDFIANGPFILERRDHEARQRTAANVGAAVSAVRERFGPSTTVVVSNLYDPSEGTGITRGCFFSQFLPPVPPDAFVRWNEAIGAAVVAAGGVVHDAHALFVGHGIDAPEPWLLSDCIHPNEVGHAALFRGVLDSIDAAAVRATALL
jgi:lysophospholipase L1-like esterase